jgi:uncharacterized protein
MSESLAWIETVSGVQFNLVDTKPEMIQIGDVAHSLSNMSRFTGHAKYPYSVGQHTLLGSYLFEDKALAFRFLNHDDSEAYIGDMNRPLKHFTPVGEEFRKVEAPLQKMIYARFGIFGPDPEIIHEIDHQMLYAEKKALMGNTPFPVKWSEGEVAADVLIEEMPWRLVKRLWLDRFYELYNSNY